MEILQQANFFFGPLFATFLLGFATIALYLWYSSRKLTYWKKKGIPHAKPYPLFGSMLQNLKKPFQEAECDRYKEHGRIYGFYEGNRACLTVGEPEILRNILVKDFHAFSGRRSIAMGNKILESMVNALRGEDWKRVRTIVTPTFSTGKIKRMLGIFKDCSRTLVKNFREASEKGEPIDSKSIYGAFTMDVIASTAFSTKIDSHNDPNNEFVTAARDVFTRKRNLRFVLYALFPAVVKFLGISVFPPKCLEFFTKMTLQIIEERKRTGQKRNDFLQLLMDTAKEAADEGKLDLNEKDDIDETYGKVDSNQMWKNYYAKKTLSHEELVAQCVIFFLAGYDTTASTLSFTSYVLAVHPDIQEKVIQEVDDVLRANNGELTYEGIQSMKYLDNVIAETLRLYPPAIRLERIADEDYKLGDTGLTVPKGMLVGVPLYAMHRDPKLFPDPEKFDPDRFLPEERAKQVPYSYLPFGAGPRNCVALRFALMEVKVCLVHVLSNFRIKKCSETKVPLEFHTGQSLLQPKTISLLMEIRKDAVKAL